ncbi:Flp pilus assembly complex ATPase component TadA [Candidatus Beckwithbacteria bacterium]|nr:Flp pilus assembly complex ATPase component TadA [Candidatus Beckwithbacteria bacterium]
MKLSTAQLEKILVGSGFVNAQDFKLAAKSAAELNIDIADILIFRGIISEQALGQLIAEHLKVPFITIGQQVIPMELMDLIPEKIARSHSVVPFALEKNNLKLAMSDPNDFEAVEFVRRHTGYNVEPFYATTADIRKALGQYKRNIRKDFEQIISQNIKLAGKGADLLKVAEDLPIVKILDTVLDYAIAEGTSDIHIEVNSNEVMIRFRVDGMLRDIIALPKKIESALVARIKILANLKIDEHRIPQDGRYKYDMSGEVVAFRVSIIPGYYGENVVLRLLPETTRPHSLEELGFGGKNLEILKNQIHRPHGMILVTGPTGSGKTTSLYSVLNMLNNVNVKICTIEDPIEYGLNRLIQIQVNNKSGLTFAAGLRALLRHDPDIMMVGEIRDTETAEIAVHAALTGHLVLTTLHTNDAPGAIPRMLDMGVEAYLLSSTVNVVLAQRLVRKICQNCLYEQKPDTATLEYFKKMLGRDISKQKFYAGKGCEECGQTGYKGRIGIYELFEVNEEIRQLTIKGASGDELKAQAQKDGMKTMMEDGIDKVASGQTTLEEVLRAVRE